LGEEATGVVPQFSLPAFDCGEQLAEGPGAGVDADDAGEFVPEAPDVHRASSSSIAASISGILSSTAFSAAASTSRTFLTATVRIF
jgi:hypothetical protein